MYRQALTVRDDAIARATNLELQLNNASNIINNTVTNVNQDSSMSNDNIETPNVANNSINQVTSQHLNEVTNLQASVINELKNRLAVFQSFLNSIS